MVNNFAAQIDLSNSSVILQYGAGAQKKMADFSESALENVRTKDLGEVGDVLSSLVVELKNNAPGTEKKRGFFQRSKIKMDEMRAQYQKAEGNVDNICRILEQHQVALMKDVAMFDQMFELNQQYYKELTMYIIAGKKKLEACRTGEMAQLRAKAEQTGAQEDAQAYNDYANLMERFDKKINDLELTRIISENVNIPVIASGGAGTKEHFYDAFEEGRADAALAASLFHFKELEIMDLKRYLSGRGIPMRL